MKIQFLGTAAAEGVPSVFCDCANCKLIRSLGPTEYRTRAQVMIDDCLSVDFPPDAFYHSLRFGLNYSNLRYILATHSHFDHFYAHDFVLRGYKYAKLSVPSLEIYGNCEVAKVFDECTARELREDVKPNLTVKTIKAYRIFEVGEYRVIALPANHSKTEEALLFYIESKGKGYLHFYDTAPVEDNVLNFLKDCGVHVDLVCLDCTFVEESARANARHMGISDDLKIKKNLIAKNIADQNTKFVISHFSHNGNPTRANLSKIEQKYGVIAAYDGLIEEI